LVAGYFEIEGNFSRKTITDDRSDASANENFNAGIQKHSIPRQRVAIQRAKECPDEGHPDCPEDDFSHLAVHATALSALRCS
jgi:hypothetical protein